MTALDVISQHFGPTNGVQLALIRNIGRLSAEALTRTRTIRGLSHLPLQCFPGHRSLGEGGNDLTVQRGSANFPRHIAPDFLQYISEDPN